MEEAQGKQTPSPEPRACVDESFALGGLCRTEQIPSARRSTHGARHSSRPIRPAHRVSSTRAYTRAHAHRAAPTLSPYVGLPEKIIPVAIRLFPRFQLLENGGRGDGDMHLKFLPQPAASPGSSRARPSWVSGGLGGQRHAGA